MAFAVISDIHANLEALEAVLADIKGNNISEVYNLGDTVGYGPDPKACIERVRSFPSVKGNHDVMSIEGFKEDMMPNWVAKESLIWTGQQLSQEEKDYLSSLPYTLKVGDGFVLAHANLIDPPGFKYLTTNEAGFSKTPAYETMNMLELSGDHVAFVGHTHEPRYYEKSIHGQVQFRVFNVHEKNQFCLRPKIFPQIIVNVGSVGQPRDRNPDACWVEANEALITLHRTPYDFKKTQEKIRSRCDLSPGAADALTNRLELGK